jgi:hypothetical protein
MRAEYEGTKCVIHQNNVVRNCFNLKRKVKRKGERNQNMMERKKFTNLCGHEKKE